MVPLAWMFSSKVSPAPQGWPIEVRFDQSSGRYTVSDNKLEWEFAGTIGRAVKKWSIRQSGPASAQTRVLTLVLGNGPSDRAKITWGEKNSTVRFDYYYGAVTKKPVVFPNFGDFPTGLRGFSFRNSTFAPPVEGLETTSTPWLLFDDRNQAAIFSPASHFLNATMVGGLKSSLGESLSPTLDSIPAGTDQASYLTFGRDIRDAWLNFGTALRAPFKKPLPSPDCNPIVQKFGYWTDNGAYYYYNYEKSLGYAGTLEAVAKRWSDLGMPLAYMQLDSWWYQKSNTGADGKPGPDRKNGALAPASWNVYGGTMIYRAHPDLFPHGLDSFQKRIGLPLAVHARWIDRASPYHQSFKFSGVAAIDPRWWAETAAYLRQSGVVLYEQDWLDHIFDYSPEMSTKLGVADAFADGMAKEMARKGIQLQYCMALPRFFLQGAEYANLTTIRTSDDRFDKGKWVPFIFDSQLAWSAGIWPWCDVFMSRESANTIIATLSGGPVGVGDKLGTENLGNVQKVALPDGTIVKPDRPLLPVDGDYANPAGPFVADTEVDHANGATTYVFAFPQKTSQTTATYSPKAKPDLIALDLNTGTASLVSPGKDVDLSFGSIGYSLTELAPVSPAGIAIFGDLGKTVTTGRQRIPTIVDKGDSVEVGVAFTSGEKSVDIEGWSRSKPVARAISGTIMKFHYDSDSHVFVATVKPEGLRATIIISTN